MLNALVYVACELIRVRLERSLLWSIKTKHDQFLILKWRIGVGLGGFDGSNRFRTSGNYEQSDICGDQLP